MHSTSRRITDDPQEDGSKCSIFSFDISANRNRLPLARNALRKLRTLRHPGIIKVLDTVEVGRHQQLHTRLAQLTGDQGRQTS